MSERMTDEAVTRAVATVLDDVSHHGAVDAVQALGVECSRARASEEQKDAVIKALADALWHLHTRVVLSAQSAAIVADALRLAGRLP